MNLGGFYDKRFEEGKYGKKAVHLSPDPNHYHQKILKIIKRESEDRPFNILDVGCATGYLRAKAKTYNKNNYVCGIEISEIAAKKAKKVQDIKVGSIFTKFFNKIFDASFAYTYLYRRYNHDIKNRNNNRFN